MGDGSDKDHFRVCMAIVALLLNSEGRRIFKERYTLVAFGRSDKERHYHPVSFMVTSHETSDDNEYFYCSVVIIC